MPIQALYQALSTETGVRAELHLLALKNWSTTRAANQALANELRRRIAKHNTR